MADFFDFSFPGFGDSGDSFSGIFDNLGFSFGESLPDIAQQVAKFGLSQALGGGASGNPGLQLLNSFARSGFGSTSSQSRSDSYFQTSSGQSMAQLASLISRASSRFL